MVTLLNGQEENPPAVKTVSVQRKDSYASRIRCHGGTACEGNIMGQVRLMAILGTAALVY